MKTESIVLMTIERAINSLCKLYSSAKAKGVMAKGIAASIMEVEKFAGEIWNNINPK